jgi:hypothetical protein
MKAKVRCIETYNDNELKCKITNNPEDKNYERVVSMERAIVLDEARVCEILEAFNEEEIENAKINNRKKCEKEKKETK